MKDFYIFFLFIALSFFLKSVGLGQTSYDWDESTYLIIGKLWLKGGSIYTDFIDTKPIGIFIISSLCGFLKIEYGIIAFRLLGALFVATGGFFSYLIFKTFINNHKNAVTGGMIFIGMFYFVSSIGAWKNGLGLESNTEHFFVPLIPVSVYLLLRKSRLFLFLSGLILGFSFIIKYFVIIDAIIILILILGSSLSQNKSLAKNLESGIKNCLIWGIAFSTPFLITVLIFYFSKNWTDFSFITFTVGSNYSSDLELSRIVNFLKRIFYLFPIFLFIILTNFFSSKRKNDLYFQIGLLWLLVDLTFITIAGKFFNHYYYQLIPTLCLLTTISLNNLSSKKLKMAHIALIAIAIISFGYRLNTEIKRIDFPKNIASYILNVDKNPTLYCANYQHIIYMLCDTNPPTKYIHPDLIYNTEFSKPLGIDTNKEIGNILDKSPNWIILKDHFPIEHMDFKNNYTLKKTFQGNIKLFVNKDYMLNDF